MFKDTEEGVAIGYLLELVFEGGAQTAKKFLTDKKVVRVTLFSKRNQVTHKAALVFVGPPNTVEKSDLKNGRSKVGFTDVKYLPTAKEKEEARKAIQDKVTKQYKFKD